MQAGLTNRRLTLREILPPTMVLCVSKEVAFGQSTVLVIVNGTRMLLAAWQHLMTEAPMNVE
jgi:hypothetical protein